MRLIKYTHACVRLEQDGAVLVIDPGIWSEPRALRGADAVLVTHEHADHIDVLRLAGLNVPVYAPAGAKIPDLAHVSVVPDQEFTAAGFRVRALGGRHAVIYGGQPDCANLGYLVEDRVYHPGDSLHRPEVPVETLLVPVQGSWLKTDEAIDFVRAVAPERAYGIHDAQLNDRGLEGTHGWLAEECGHDYRWLRPGETA
jgi:L-ascorbate metabolism protein UlaG (beta-lactamase superfamily)